ncbi:unnamed protein product [Fusarium equiseti]|uniref:Protein kinase domain-containing protein n=1 Tax=Fusarium equiseti TaxID=61235 RepID=A0A8J2IG45_FUSEQ|nr:unnamed protein product [Fusarium equiseti]
MRCPIDENLSEIVRDYKLKTYYEGNITVHLHNDPDTPLSAPQRRERWKKIRTIGHGGQSEVILEACVDGGRHHTERAVKKIRLQGGDSKRRYESELGAIVKFSHDRNILIHSHPQPDAQGSWWVKLGDFGISKKISGGHNITTSSVGTMLYMAPELFNVNCSDIPSNDYQEADLWSLGITIFFILTNVVPFQTPASTIKFAQNSGEPFPHALLDHYGVTEEGQAFLRETLRPVPGTRLNFAMAMDHAWIEPLFPDAAASGTQSRPSTISSRRSSIDDDGVARSLTTEISTLSSQPVTQLQFDEQYHAFNPSRQQTRSQGIVETATVDEVNADAYNGTHNSPFARCTSETPLNAERLHNAVLFGRVSDVKILLDQGVSPIASHNGQLPLHTSAIRGNVKVTRLLCDRKVDIEAKDKHGMTALLVAAACGMYTVTEFLLERGANVKAKDNNGQTALIVAAAEEMCIVIYPLLIKGADIEAKDNNGQTALLVAAAFGACTAIELLLQKGADIEAKDNNGQTALLVAVAYGKCTVIKLLLKEGADIEAKDNDGQTALVVTAAKGMYTVIELLLEKGANIEAKDNDGHTALVVAATCRHLAVIKLLLGKGADVNTRNKKSATLLATAQAREEKQFVDLLLQYGATR